MSDERPNDLLSALPRTRPHRRSEKRGAKPQPAAAEPKAAAKPKPAAKPAHTTARKSSRRSGDTRMRQPAQPRGIPSARRAPKRKPAPTTGAELVGTAVQAVGELAEIGVALGTRALRNALGRLPRP
jgi:hypothetical protein